MKNFGISKILLTIFIVMVISTQNLTAQPFVEQSGITLTGVQMSSVAWGDYNNDGNLDILLTGYTVNNSYISKVYCNNGNGTFTEQTAIQLTGVIEGSSAWGDYDNDGDLDIVITGATDTSRISKVYRNNGNNTFSEQTDIMLTALSGSSVAWGDYDNDGDPDILFTGWNGNSSWNPTSKIYHNNGNNTFSEQTGTLIPNVMHNQSAWGDYDNDGDLDILFAGWNGSTYISKIYSNNGNNTFTNQTGIRLTGVQMGSAVWGDYNNDGNLDILLTGTNNSMQSVSQIYRNNGNNTFTEQTGISLTGVAGSSVAWGDYDNDGISDIIVTGGSASGDISKIYHNNGNNTFTEQTGISLSGVTMSSVVWGDYDNDGDLDILLTGGHNNAGLSKIYRNDITTANIKPSAPPTLAVTVSSSTATLCWSPVKTDATSYKGMTYNVRVGTTTGGINIVSPQSLPNGHRLIPAMGNAQLDTFFILKNLSPGTYYWSVQAVDNGFMGGAFATEGTFTIDGSETPVIQAPTNPVVNDSANTFDWTNNPSYTAISDYEYSVDNGATWTTCPTKPINVGNVNLAAGLAKVRVKATALTSASEPVSSNVAFTINTGTIINNHPSAGIILYPNPATDKLIIIMDEWQPNTSIGLYSLSGKQICFSKVVSTQNEIDMKLFADGVYIIKAFTGKGVFAKFVVKQ